MRLDKLEWTRKMLGEILVANYGKSLPKTKRIAGNINVYGSGGIVGSHNEYLVKGPGIIIGRKGTVGSINYVKDNYYPIDTVYYIQEGLDYDLKFLFYKLKTIGLDKMNTHSAVPGLNREHMYSKEVLMPKINEQKAIAKILSDLDEKIEVNNKINKNLEEMAQAIFKQWFVDFEFPNEEGKPYKSSGGEMVESELGMIPKGFKISELKEIADDIITGKTPSTKNKENYGEKYPFITIPDMHNSIFINSSERYLSEKGSETQKSKLLPKNSIIVSCIATVGLVSITTKESHINQQINAVIIDKIEYLYYLYEAIKRKKELLLAIGSSGSATLNVNKKEFEKIKYLNPTNYYVNLFNSKVNILYEKIKANILENERLEKLRDTLLPKLMSGEIRVPLENSEN
ncbi:restriction endonuclease subunit S [Clostridium perfringens]|uniref:restriction endonuclease subunit S n=1 Tax=Clostridium perfringens TaxID=1502 RepID=UPI0013E300A1|nr:restriction endonuclease subunit S [Clostridium perfringens]NGU13071.1 restriction endonuclease subunit S [Clostridium perfringens]